MAWRFDDPKGEDGKVLHCFAVVIPANSDIKVEQIHAFTKQSDAFENIDEEVKREIPERMKRKLFEPRLRARQGIRRPYDRAEEGPLKPDEGVERDPVVYVLKNDLHCQPLRAPSLPLSTCKDERGQTQTAEAAPGARTPPSDTRRTHRTHRMFVRRRLGYTQSTSHAQVHKISRGA